jgi:protein tyrosine phosphatase (PTP) superfamily phosphohydrolase (DUF442 family)
MNKLLSIGVILLGCLLSSNSALADEHSEAFENINNFHFVSKQLASSGMLKLEEYEHIKHYGFKHVINLIPGMQLKEKRHVESLGMSYEQIPVIWDTPTLDNFKQFSAFMKSYGDDKIYVHCELNWRASTFVYLYRVTQLNMSKEKAIQDLEQIWEPKDQWDAFIVSTLAHYKK